MHGNVREWCHDWYYWTYFQDGPEVDPQGPATGVNRVMRGGSYRDDADRACSASRDSVDPTWRTDYTGFRHTRTL